MQVWIYIRDFLAIVCTKEGEVVKKGRIKTNETAIKEFFYGLRNVKIAIEASANYSYIVDALAKADLTRGNLPPTSWIPPKEIRELRDLVRQRIFLLNLEENAT